MSHNTTEMDILREICKDAKQKERINGEQLVHLTNLFGARFTKAWEAIREGRVKKYVFKPSSRIVWIVVGRERDYLVMPDADFCSCNDFYYHVMEKMAHLCYHLIAQKVADCLKWFDKIEETDDLYDILMGEWREITT